MRQSFIDAKNVFINGEINLKIFNFFKLNLNKISFHFKIC